MVNAYLRIDKRRIKCALLGLAIGTATLVIGLGVYHWQVIRFLIEFERSVASFGPRHGAMIVDDLCASAMDCRGVLGSRIVERRCLLGLRRMGTSRNIPEGWAAYAVLVQRDQLRRETWDELEALSKTPSFDPGMRDAIREVMTAITKKAIPITPPPSSTSPSSPPPLPLPPTG